MRCALLTAFPASVPFKIGRFGVFQNITVVAERAGPEQCRQAPPLLSEAVSARAGRPGASRLPGGERIGPDPRSAEARWAYKVHTSRVRFSDA